MRSYRDIAHDPVTSSILYVTTRGGIFKSINGGENWVIKKSGFPPESNYYFGAPGNDILVDPNQGNIIYVGIGVPRAGYELDSYYVETSETKGAIYKSIDYGENMTLIRNAGIDGTAMVYCLGIDSTNEYSRVIRTVIPEETGQQFCKYSDA